MVARVDGRAGHDKVADARKPRKRFPLRAESASEAGYLRKAARHKRSRGVIAELHSLDNPAAERNRIFQRRRDLAARRIIVDICAERRRLKIFLNKFSAARVIACENDRRGYSPADLFSVTRTRHDRDTVMRKFLAKHLRKPLIRAVLKALSDVQNNGFGRNNVFHFLRDFTYELGRNRKNNNVRALYAGNVGRE